MIDIAVVEDEIAALEAETETTYDICERPACLYTVRDHLKAKRHDGSKSSESLTAAVGVPHLSSWQSSTDTWRRSKSCTRRSIAPSSPKYGACTRRHNYYLSNSVKHLSHS